MTYIVKNKDEYLLFDRYVRDMEIVSTVEATSSYHAATEFSTETMAKQMVKEVEKSYDVTDFTVHDLEVVIEEEKVAKENERKAILKEAWNNTSNERKKEMLGKILEKEGPDGVKKWLDDVDDTSGITTTTNTTSTPKFCSECDSPYGTCAHTTSTAMPV